MACPQGLLLGTLVPLLSPARVVQPLSLSLSFLLLPSLTLHVLRAAAMPFNLGRYVGRVTSEEVLEILLASVPPFGTVPCAYEVSGTCIALKVWAPSVKELRLVEYSEDLHRLVGLDGKESDFPTAFQSLLSHGQGPVLLAGEVRTDALEVAAFLSSRLAQTEEVASALLSVKSACQSAGWREGGDASGIDALLKSKAQAEKELDEATKDGVALHSWSFSFENGECMAKFRFISSDGAGNWNTLEPRLFGELSETEKQKVIASQAGDTCAGEALCPPNNYYSTLKSRHDAAAAACLEKTAQLVGNVVVSILSPKRRAGSGPEGEQAAKKQAGASNAAVTMLADAAAEAEHPPTGLACPFCQKICKNEHGRAIHLSSCKAKA